jgi:hypothetical protein
LSPPWQGVRSALDSIVMIVVLVVLLSACVFYIEEGVNKMVRRG